MLIERIVFWEPSVSPHKTEFINEIARQRPEIEIFYVSQTEISQDRKKLGWTIDEFFLFKKIVNPDSGWIHRVVEEKIDSTVHVFSGIRHIPIIKIALREVLYRHALFGIMSEPRVDEGIFGVFRVLQSWITEVSIRRQVGFVLGIGRHGPEWFRRVGYNINKIYPFAYFVEAETNVSFAANAPNLRERRIIFVGRLIEMKGVGVLLAALSKLKKPTELILVGGGRDEYKYRRLAAKLKINVKFFGVRPISEIQNLIKGCSCLVLPSLTKDDGWGVVVTEALLVGVPVVVSDRVGSSLVTTHRINGVTVEAGSVSDLAEGIDAILDQPNDSYLIETGQRMAWARDHLSAAAGAGYFWSIVDYVCKRGPNPMGFFD